MGADYRFAENRALIRLFAIWEISGYTYSYPDRLGDRKRVHHLPWEPEAFSAVLFPQFSYFFSNGFEAELGGLLALGVTTHVSEILRLAVLWFGRGLGSDTEARLR